jgi:predicted HTH domain antitoxin
MAGMPVVLFMKELGRRGVYRNYSVEDALHDVQWVREKLGE